jgi:plasmid stability protein
MAAITIRNLPGEIHRALKLRAAQHGRSTEAEIRQILVDSVRPQGRLKLGTELAELAEKFAGIDFEFIRDQSPTEPGIFE